MVSGIGDFGVILADMVFRVVRRVVEKNVEF
jgi:hypothetical protein